MIPNEDTVDWIFEATRWWVHAFGGFASLQRTAITLPTPAHFPIQGNRSPEALAEDYLSQVLRHAGMSDWPFHLVDCQAPHVADLLFGMPHHMTSAPTGGEPALPESTPDRRYVSYSEDMLANPLAFIADLARTVSHHLLTSAEPPLDVDAEEWSFYTDLGGVYLGFGVFMANTSFQFYQTQNELMAGWGYARQGALSELDLSYVLALMATLQEVPTRPILKHLRPNPKSFFKSASKHIRRKRKKDLERITHVGGGDGGPYR